MLENFVPEYESTVSQKFIDAGTVLLGKANLDEFAMGTFSKTSFFGAPVNPWQMEKRLTAGGSSGGSTSSVAGGLAIAATGTDTGGSIRFPSAMTGLVGMKPTYGLCSRWGCVAFASSLDTPGPIARTVEDTALMLSAMAGHDPKDSTSSPKAHFESDGNLQPVLGDGKKLRIGVIKEFNNVKISDDMKILFEKRIADLKSMGAEIVEVSIPNILDALAAYYIIAPAEASSNLARYDGMRYGLRVEGDGPYDTYKKTRAAGFGEEVQRRMIIGTAVLSSESYEVYFMQAARVRRMIADSFKSAFEQCDLIVCPSSAGTAMPLDSDLTPLEYYALDLFTVAMNLAGIPSVSVPCGLAQNGLPLGMQVVGPRFADMKVLQLAKHIESAANVDNRPTIIMGK
jgi:aspartyl-tRNA(Asn)/glutamyl-tRNA(Gln) amidotransferase subunit A